MKDFNMFIMIRWITWCMSTIFANVQFLSTNFIAITRIVSMNFTLMRFQTTTLGKRFFTLIAFKWTNTWKREKSNWSDFATRGEHCSNLYVFVYDVWDRMYRWNLSRKTCKDIVLIDYDFSDVDWVNVEVWMFSSRVHRWIPRLDWLNSLNK